MKEYRGYQYELNENGFVVWIKDGNWMLIPEDDFKLIVDKWLKEQNND